MPVLNPLLFLGLWTGGLRPVAAWTAAAVALWALALWRPPDWRAVPSARRWAAWLAWTAASALACAEPLRAVAAFSRPLTAALFFAMACTHWRTSGRRWWFWGLTASGAGLGLATLYVIHPGSPWVGLLYPYYNYTVCVEAMAFAACLGALGKRKPASPAARFALLSLMAGCVALMVLARSRGGLLACAAAGALWTWRKGWRRPLAAMTFAGLALLVLTRAVWAPLLKFDRPGAYVRPALWRSAVAIAGDHPLLGVGPGLYEEGFLLHQFPAKEEDFPARFGLRSAHAHSELLQIAAETGWPGFFLFLWAFLSTWTGAWRKKDGEPAREAGLLALAAVSVQGLFDNLWNLPSLQWLFFSSLAAAGEDPKAPAHRVPAWARPLCAGGLLLAAAAWTPDWAVRRFEDRAFKSSGEEAVESMRRALRIAPADAGLWEDLARVHLRRSPPEAALASQALSEAARRDPSNALYPLMQGEIAGSRGRWAQAAANAEEAIGLEPHFMEARLLRADALCRLGRRDEAAREMEAARATRLRNADFLTQHGYAGMIVRFDRGRFDAVSGALGKGCRKTPQPVGLKPQAP